MRRIIAYAWPHIKRYRISVIATFFTYGIGTYISSIVTPIYYKRIIDTISGSGSPIAVKEEILALVGMFFVFVVLYVIFYRIGDYTLNYSRSKIMHELTTSGLNMITDHSQRFFADTFSGSLVAKFRRYVDRFHAMYDTLVFNVWFLIIPLVGAFVVLLREHRLLGVLFLVWVVVYIIVISIFVRHKIKYDIKRAEMDSEVTAQFADIITNILTIKIFSGKPREQVAFEELAGTQEKIRRTAWNFAAHQNLIQGVLLIILEVGSIYLTVRLWLDGAISPGTIVLVQAYNGVIFGRLWPLGRAITRMMEALADSTEMVEVFDQKRDVDDPRRPQKPAMNHGEIRFDNIAFQYKDGQKVFHNFSLSIPQGQKVGLVGHSGSGKTTLTKILMRFSDIQQGSITIDGQDIRKVRQDDLRRHISFVPQEPLLFHRTIRDNIAYPRPDATDEEVINAAKKAHAHEFIEEFNEGYDTYVGERGVKLSGGQRQRVAIARVMLEGAPILVLDEATSSLDSISEKLIQSAFDEVMTGKTTIVVAHRLSTIQKMDRIIVLNKGIIAEDGNHEELLALHGQYYKLWSHQTDGFIG